MISKKYQIRLQRVLNSIPKGKVATYGYVAKRLGVHPRVAGFLLSRNDASKAPCYKVVRSTGELGGYSAPGGLQRKVILLRRDGIDVKSSRVDLNRFGLK